MANLDSDQNRTDERAVEQYLNKEYVLVRWQTFYFLLAFGGISGFAAWWAGVQAAISSSAGSQAQRELVQMSKEAEKIMPVFKQATPPLFAAVPYFGDAEPPPGWTICDGKRLNEDFGFHREDVAAELWGKYVPDLRGRFLRGRRAEEELGASAGSDKLPKITTETDGSHTHSFVDPKRGLDGLTGPIARLPDAPQDEKRSGMSQRYTVTDPFGNHQYEANISAPTDKLDQRQKGAGQHKHSLTNGDGTECAWAKSAGSVKTVDGEGQHFHEIKPVDFVPSYTAVNFIIRIK